MNKKYTPLHCHSDASLLDGLSNPKDIVKRIKEIGSTGCAITDHGVISNCIAFLKVMTDAGLKPVLGIELYICEEHANVKGKEERSLAHLCILAKNTQGWKQILKIVHETNKPEHYYYKPRISLEELSQFLDGNIIGFSGHLGSNVSNAIQEYGIDGGKKMALYLNKIFGEGNFYLECQLMDRIHNPEMVTICDAVREISKETGIPCLATPDAHYTRHEDSVLQRIILCSNMRVTIKQALDPNFQLRSFFISDNYHIPTYEEMVSYGHTDEELENSNKILEQIEKYDILSSPQLPNFPCPNGMTEDEYLKHLCREGYKKIIAGKIPQEKIQEYGDRIKYELEVITRNKLSGYFLILWDIINFCREKGWLTGPGRGSAAGCMVSYLLGITKVDSIKYDLLFERFYNDGRAGSLPDIDTDFEVEHRDEVVEYVKQKYGEEHVTQILTFQNMKGARSLKEVFRAYGDVPHEEVNRMTKNIIEEHKITDELQEMEEHEEGSSSIIRWCLENPTRAKLFKEWVELEDGKIVGPYAQQFQQALELEGVKAAQSRHAAGIVVSKNPLDETCPMILDTKSKRFIGGLTMNDMEAIGLCKMDILGLNALDKLSMIHRLNPNFSIDYNYYSDDNFSDLETWELISSGKTKGVFQLESKLGQTWSKKLKPELIEHLSALSAILRPGCISEDTNILISISERKNGKNNLKKLSIKELHKRFHNNHNTFINQIIAYDEKNHKLINTKIKNIWSNGIRKIYKIKFTKTNRGNEYCGKRKYKLECTDDHKIFVYGRGWVELRDLRYGDRFTILSDGEGREQKSRQKLPKGQKSFRDVCFKHYIRKCIQCGWLEASLDVNHIEENRTLNNNAYNLCFMCPNHHREYTDGYTSKEDIIKYRKEFTLPQNDDLFWAEFIGYELVGEKEVFDIEVEGENHSFIAGDTVVHNCMEAEMEDGKNVTDHYVKRKNLEEAVTYIHDAVKPILEKTEGLLIYQESAMKLAALLAGFDLKQADALRKAIGKKKADLMAKVKKEFLTGAEKVQLVPIEVAEEIFGWIEKSQRYSFNKSHSLSYSFLSYMTAYAKKHFTKEFFTSYLYYAREKPRPQEEIYELVNDAKNFNIYVQPPSIRFLNNRFALINGQIYFGLSDIKHVGDSIVNIIKNTSINVEKCNWIEFLTIVSDNINSRAMESLINSGACDCFNIARIKMSFEYGIFNQLTAREKEFIRNLGENDSLQSILNKMANLPVGRGKAVSNKNRLEKIKGLLKLYDEPPYELVDKPHQVAQQENLLLGVCLTATFLDESKIKFKANCSCQEFNDGYNSKNSYISIACQIDGIKTTTIKRGPSAGEEMAFLTVSDDSGISESIVLFSEPWAKYKDLAMEGNRILISGKRTKDKNSLAVESVEQI